MKKIGLIAGNNRFPILVAEEIKKHGDIVVCVALNGITDIKLEGICDRIYWVSIGKFQKIINIFKTESVDTVIMAGQVKHVTIYSSIFMDFRALKLMSSLINKKTDTILNAIADEFQKDGITLIPSNIYLTNLIAQKGLITGKKLSLDENKNIDFGYKIAKCIAGFDIGQTIVVKDMSVLSVESVEGTDECIKRAYNLGGDNSIVIKVAKPKQDFRFDIPVIGLRTIDVLKENKVKILAIESFFTLMLDKNEVIKKAENFKITIFGI
jgi:DUF1009 family protein